MGGSDPLTSKVAVVKKSERDGVDVDYLFLQVFVDQPIVTDSQNCGNILAGVGPFAIERGLVAGRTARPDVASSWKTPARLAIATVETPGGKVDYAGDARIDGVPGTSAPADHFRGYGRARPAARCCPPAMRVDMVEGVEVTMIDNGMPCVVMSAEDMGITGDETPEELEANDALRARLEAIRLKAGR
jgi:4-oxalomesaconate tautomerase